MTSPAGPNATVFRAGRRCATAAGIVFMVNGRGRVSPTIGLQPQNEMGKPGDGVFIRRLTWLCTRVTLDSL